MSAFSTRRNLPPQSLALFLPEMLLTMLLVNSLLPMSLLPMSRYALFDFPIRLALVIVLPTIHMCMYE